MNILKNKKILKGLGQQIDLANTLTGGVAMAQVAVKPKKDRIEVSVHVPSVPANALQVVVEYNRLILLGTLPAAAGSEQPAVAMPLFSQVLDIPFHVEVENIQAQYQDGRLKVILPYAEGRTRLPRTVDIDVLD